MEAATRYATGISLASVSAEFSVHEGTLTRELQKREFRFGLAEGGIPDLLTWAITHFALSIPCSINDTGIVGNARTMNSGGV